MDATLVFSDDFSAYGSAEVSHTSWFSTGITTEYGNLEYYSAVQWGDIIEAGEVRAWYGDTNGPSGLGFGRYNQWLGGAPKLANIAVPHSYISFRVTTNAPVSAWDMELHIKCWSGDDVYVEFDYGASYVEIRGVEYPVAESSATATEWEWRVTPTAVELYGDGALLAAIEAPVPDDIAWDVFYVRCDAANVTAMSLYTLDGFGADPEGPPPMFWSCNVGTTERII